MAETIKEFLVSLGYQIDGGSETKFKNSVAAATKGAVALGLSLTAAATAVSAAVTKIAAGFDEMFYMSQRAGASVQNIKGLSYAVSQLGGSYQGAVGSIESFAQKMRSNPGIESMAKSLGVVTRENGKLRDTTKIAGDLVKVLSKKPDYIALQYVNAFGWDERTYFAMKNGDYQRWMDEYAAKARALGVDQERAAKIGQELTSAWRSLGATAELIGAKLEQTLGRSIASFVKDIDDFLIRNADKIVKFFEEAGKAAAWLAGAFQKLVEALTPAWEAFDQIARSVTGQSGLQVALEAFALWLVGSWLLRILGAFTAVGKGWGLMLLRMGINPATIALGVGATSMGVGPAADYFREKGKAEGITDPDVAQVAGTAKAAQGAWNWVKRKLGFGGKDEAEAKGIGNSSIPGLSEKGAADYSHRLGKRESGNNYAQPGNQYGFRGRWQMGGPALADAGYVKSGTSNRALTDPSNWTGKDGVGSLDDFLANKGGGQDKAFAAYTAINFRNLKKAGILKDGMSEEDIASWLAVAHLKGIGGAKLLAAGSDNVDGNGTAASSYFRMMKGLKTGAKLSPEQGSPFIGSLQGFNAGALSNAQSNAALIGGGIQPGGGAPLLPPANSNSTTIDMNPKTEITILGGSDPGATASAVADAQKGVNGSLLRNMQGAVR